MPTPNTLDSDASDAIADTADTSRLGMAIQNYLDEYGFASLPCIADTAWVDFDILIATYYANTKRAGT